MRSEIDRVLQIQPGDQPLLLVKQLAYRAFFEDAVLHIPIQLAAGLCVQGADEEQISLFLPVLRPKCKKKPLLPW